MGTEDGAAAAIEVLNDVYKFRLDAEHPISVKVANDRGKKDKDQGSVIFGGISRIVSSWGDMADATKVFVGNLPEDIRDDELESVFKTYGEVEKVDVLRKDRVCAFVKYITEDGAAAAIEVLNDVYKF